MSNEREDEVKDLLDRIEDMRLASKDEGHDTEDSMTLADAINCIMRLAARQSAGGWLRAVDEEMVMTHLGIAEATDDYEVAKKKLASLIQWHVTVALDPAVSEDAQALIDQGRQSAGATGQEPVGVAGTMPGTGDGFTMACFKASDVPLGTKLYAAPIGDNGANEVCSGCDGEKGYLVDGLPYTCTQCDGKGTAPQPAESKRVELTDEELKRIYRLANRLTIELFVTTARAMLARASTKGE
jgi:hypothetical protein